MDKITKVYIIYSVLLLVIFLVNDNGGMENKEKIGVAVFLSLFTILAKHMPSKMISTVEYFGIQLEEKSIQSFRAGLYALKYFALVILIFLFVITLQQTLSSVLNNKDIVNSNGIVLGWMTQPIFLGTIIGVDKALEITRN